MCSSLNSDLHRVNIKFTPAYSCGHPVEDSIHYCFECVFTTKQEKYCFQNLKDKLYPIELLLTGDGDLSVQQNK